MVKIKCRTAASTDSNALMVKEKIGGKLTELEWVLLTIDNDCNYDYLVMLWSIYHELRDLTGTNLSPKPGVTHDVAT